MRASNTSERLQTLMQLKGLTQADILRLCDNVSDKVGCKISKQSLSQYVSGQFEPNSFKLTLLGVALNVSETWLMGYDVPMSREVTLEKIERKDKSVLVPVYSAIPAGVPMEMIEDVTGFEEISSDMCKGDNKFFGLKVKGSSMYPKYMEGDIIIVLSQNNCESGDDCVISIGNDDATLKKVVKLKDSIMLQPINTEYAPVIYSNKEIKYLPVRILGVVKELRRKI